MKDVKNGADVLTKSSEKVSSQVNLANDNITNTSAAMEELSASMETVSESSEAISMSAENATNMVGEIQEIKDAMDQNATVTDRMEKTTQRFVSL